MDALPNELLIQIASSLSQADVYRFLRLARKYRAPIQDLFFVAPTVPLITSPADDNSISEFLRGLLCRSDVAKEVRRLKLCPEFAQDHWVNDTRRVQFDSSQVISHVLPQIQHWTRNTSSTFTEYELLGAILKSVPKLVELSIHIYYRPCVCVGTAHPFLIFLYTTSHS
jgi:hypothetical protein